MSKSVAIIGTRGYPSYYGGFETLVRRLGPYLVEAGWDVTVYGRPGATKTDDPVVDPRVRSVMTRGLETKSLSTLSYGLTSSLSAIRQKPDVALIMNVANGFWIPLLRARGIPSVVNVDGIEWERAKWGATAKRVFRAGAAVTASQAGTIICDSTEIQRRWLDEYGRKSWYIPYGGDVPSELSPIAEFPRRSYVLMVARFVPENTVAEFVEAARILSEKFSVVIVGSSGYGGEIEGLVRELASGNERVTWMGHISDDKLLFSLWQNCGVYFHGHSVGGTNPALVQAMACGAPTVARDTVYNREVLGDSAVFAQPNAADIAAKIRITLNDSAALERLSVAALERVRSSFTWEQVCAQYVSALHSAVTKRASTERKAASKL